MDKAGEDEDFVEHLYPTSRFGTSNQDLHEDGAIQGGSQQLKKVGAKQFRKTCWVLGLVYDRHRSGLTFSMKAD